MKFVQEYCTICDKVLAMPVVQEDEKHPGLIWVRCPECREIKPIESTGQEKPGSNRSASSPVAETAKRIVRHYRAGERFAKGDWIYHPEWRDTGRVVDKIRSGGGHDIIVVHFEKVGEKRLVSNFTS